MLFFRIFCVFLVLQVSRKVEGRALQSQNEGRERGLLLYTEMLNS